MRPIVTPEQMARADAAAIAAGTSAEVLMERAGRAVARAVLDRTFPRYGKRAVVVCGRGNNGGDGFVVARRLLGAGMSVTCALVAEEGSITGAAGHHLDLLRRAGARVRGFDPHLLRRADVIVDAIFGTGFKGRAEGALAEAIEAINNVRGHAAPRPLVVAVDIPSGVSGASGIAGGPAVRADVTVAVAAEKLGTFLVPGASFAGTVQVAGIGIPVQPDMSAVESDDVAAMLPQRGLDAHKRTSGAVAILAGSRDMTGAAVLAARGAARAGAGYVRLGAPAAVKEVAARFLPEALISPLTEEATLGPGALVRWADAIERSDVLAVGPGLGRDEAQHALVSAILEDVDSPLVLDADALNVLEGDAARLSKRRADRLVITPHAAELGRLTGVTAREVQADRVGVARAAASDFNCVVVLKGARTVIASPSEVVLNPTGGPALASAGTGDVLTGAVAAFMAGGLDAHPAAVCGVFLHGLAGTIAAEGRPSEGVVAWDVAESLPAARARVSASSSS